MKRLLKPGADLVLSGVMEKPGRLGRRSRTRISISTSPSVLDGSACIHRSAPTMIDSGYVAPLSTLRYVFSGQ
ncbi:MAG: hypothetical protein U5O39_08665 [Gammaproteobacteria bacterium]|nr:hypothetical protein [Gammaproteobacteria bacterium]